MKYIIAIVLLLGAGQLWGQLPSQDKYYYYDAAGNRKARSISIRESGGLQDNEEQVEGRSMEKLEGITIFPNPTVEYITVESETFLESAQLELYDGSGRLVQELLMTSTRQNIDITTLPSGLYVLYLRSGDKVSQWQVVKK